MLFKGAVISVGAHSQKIVQSAAHRLTGGTDGDETSACVLLMAKPVWLSGIVGISPVMKYRE